MPDALTQKRPTQSASAHPATAPPELRQNQVSRSRRRRRAPNRPSPSEFHSAHRVARRAPRSTPTRPNRGGRRERHPPAAVVSAGATPAAGTMNESGTAAAWRASNTSMTERHHQSPRRVQGGRRPRGSSSSPAEATSGGLRPKGSTTMTTPRSTCLRCDTPLGDARIAYGFDHCMPCVDADWRLMHRRTPATKYTMSSAQRPGLLGLPKSGPRARSLAP